VASFASATAQMIDNFDVALTKFETEVRAGKANIRVTRRENSGSPGGGGGGLGPLALGTLLILLVARIRARTARVYVQSHTLLLSGSR
jgi:hypothetical protein